MHHRARRATEEVLAEPLDRAQRCELVPHGLGMASHLVGGLTKPIAHLAAVVTPTSDLLAERVGGNRGPQGLSRFADQFVAEGEHLLGPLIEARCELVQPIDVNEGHSHATTPPVIP